MRRHRQFLLFKKTHCFWIQFASVLCFWITLLCVIPAHSKELDAGGISQRIALVFEGNHYTRHPLDAELSHRFLESYLDLIDCDHLIFIKSDIDEIRRVHEATLAQEIKDGQIDGAISIDDLYRSRAAVRMKKIVKYLAETKFDFSSDRTAEISRAHSPWPMDEAEADKIWSRQIESEVLDEKLNDSTLAEGVQRVRERYEQLSKELELQTKKEGMALVLSALAHAYDPHSEYLTKSDLEDLDSDMRLSMVGVGVVLEPEGRYVKIISFLPGGPAAVDGRLKINDRIVAVAHGDGDFEDVVGMKFDRVLDLLRVKKGVGVRLQVIGSRGSGTADRREVALTPRKIELTDEVARAEIIERPMPDGGTGSLGWITLPSFYGDPQHPEDRGVARDVRSLLLQMNRHKIQGLVIDLRGNPGGELEEAVDLGGLFLGKVPIVQEKDFQGKSYVSKASMKKIYNGPVVVLTNHLTASAAELFASALKDYHRGLIVGGSYSTYGKGSIQTVVDLSDLLPRSLQQKGESLGALDLTIGKFYRVSGSSTQLRGLEADLHLPSPEDLNDEGESALSFPLAYDEIAPVIKSPESKSFPIQQLSDLSAKRVSEDPEFASLSAELERDRKNFMVNQVSLNETKRRAEMEALKKQKKESELVSSQRKVSDEKILKFAPEGIKIKEGDECMKPLLGKAPSSDSAKGIDPVRGETLNILSDLIRLAEIKH